LPPYGEGSFRERPKGCRRLQEGFGKIRKAATGCRKVSGGSKRLLQFAACFRGKPEVYDILQRHFLPGGGLKMRKNSNLQQVIAIK